MDEVICANYRPADNNLSRIFALMEQMVSGQHTAVYMRRLRCTRKEQRMYGTLICLASHPCASIHCLAMIHAATFLLTNEKG